MAKPKVGRKKKHRAKKGKRIVIITLEILVLLFLLAAVWIYAKFSAIKDVTFDEDQVKTNEEVDSETTSGYTTIALFGLDTDGVDNIYAGGRSDSIIIASINNSTKEVKLASVYRDTYLNLSDNSYSKANAAYSEGGAAQAISMLNMNLDLTIDKYIAINYNALIDVVDELGGIDLELEDYEIVHMNNYMVDIADATGKTYIELTTAGLNTVSGMQATAYCRIRYGGGDDYKRTERQRLVIEKILEKAKTTDISTLNSIVDSVSSEVNTNLELTEILSLTADAANYNLTETTGFPFTHTWASTGSYSAVVVNGLSYNVSQLHAFLYGDEDYQPSATVETISDYIENRTGVTTQEIEEDTTTDDSPTTETTE